MQKIISLFQRNYDGDRLVRDEIVPGAEWVAAGEGTATQKFDGTCCMIRSGKLYRRFDRKLNRPHMSVREDQYKPAPDGWEAAQQQPDPGSKHWPGWIPVTDRPDERWHLEAFNSRKGRPDGTYELCGPKINGNPERLREHILVPHGEQLLRDTPRRFDELKEYLEASGIEGIVWHHPDGRMVKIKGKDFGIKRRQPQDVTE